MKQGTTWIVLALAFALAGCGGEKKENAPAGGTGQAASENAPAPESTPAQAPPASEPQASPAPSPAPAERKPAETRPAPAPSSPAPAAPKPTDAEPVTKLMTLVPGYEFQVALDETVSTETHAAGRAFQAKLLKPAVLKTVGPVIPAGSNVRGEVTYSKRAARVGGKAQLTLEFRELTTPDGKQYPLMAKPLVLEGESTASGDVQKVLGGAVGGAILGGILGGKEGAVKGGAAGAAGGAAWAVGTRGNDIVIDPGQVLQLTLERELRVPVTVPAGQAIP